MLKNNDNWHEIFKVAALNNEEAFKFLVSLSDIYRVWDDTWDKNRSHDKASFDAVFSDLAFGEMNNEFFASYSTLLRYQIAMSWIAWKTSNEWAMSGTENMKNYASCFQHACDDVIILVALLRGGKQHALLVSDLVRKTCLNEMEASNVHK